LVPTVIQALRHETIVAVAAGELHSACVTADGDVYTWGDGFCGQLGLGDKRPQVLPQQVRTGGLDEECVSHVSCGSRHTLAVTEDGECFSWGLGHFGVLGRSFTPFEYDADAVVVAFATTAGGGDGEDDDVDDDNAVLQRARQMAMDVQVDHRPQAAAAAPRDAAAELAAHLDLINNLSLEDASDQCIARKIDSLQGIRIVGSSAGHRHSLLLDADGYLYSFGAGSSGCLGHGDTAPHMYPCRIQAFDEGDVRIRQMSAGVDISMAVSVAGHVYGWGKTDSGRLGLGMAKSVVSQPRRVFFGDDKKDRNDPSRKAVDVECGYVHSLIVGLNGTVHVCGGVGVDGEEDGQQRDASSEEALQGRPRMLEDFNIWHRTSERKEKQVKKERWKKYGKYEVKGRSKMLKGDD